MGVTRSALELAGHEALRLTTIVGVPRPTGTAHPSVKDLSASRMNSNLRAELGFPIYAGQTGLKRTELLALFACCGIPVAPAAVMTWVEDLAACISILFEQHGEREAQ